MRRSKLLNGVNMKIAAATSVVIFTLLTVFTGTYAWFQAIKTKEITTNEFTVTNGGMSSVDKIYFYQYIETVEVEEGEKKTQYYTFNTEESGGSSVSDGTATYTFDDEDGLRMANYSTMNAHQPVLIVFRLKVGSSLANITAKTTSTYFTEGNYIESAKKPLSSVVEFYSFKYTAEGAGSLDDGKINNHYAIKVDDCVRTGANKNQSSFVTLSNNGDYIPGSFNQKITLFDGDTTGYRYIGIVVDYYGESLQYIYSYHLGHANLNNNLSFDCDWGMYI